MSMIGTGTNAIRYGPEQLPPPKQPRVEDGFGITLTLTTLTYAYSFATYGRPSKPAAAMKENKIIDFVVSRNFYFG